MKLICIPFAGGNRYSFTPFYPFFDNKVDCITLELPGRGKRFKENLLTDISDMVADLFNQIQPYLDDDYVLFGHSMGGILGNCLLHKLSNHNQRVPLRFMVTGCCAPQQRDQLDTLHQLNDKDFIEELNKLGGFPSEVLKDQELMSFLLPIIRSDIFALEKYVYSFKTKHHIPLIIVHGNKEALDENQKSDWLNETSNTTEFHTFDGNHFFILDHYPQLAQLIQTTIATVE